MMSLVLIQYEELPLSNCDTSSIEREVGREIRVWTWSKPHPRPATSGRDEMLEAFSKNRTGVRANVEFVSLGASERGKCALEQVTKQGGRGERKDPGPDNSLDHGPFHSTETFYCAHAHDRC